jgi:hypothetical protein
MCNYRLFFDYQFNKKFEILKNLILTLKTCLFFRTLARKLVLVVKVILQNLIILMPFVSEARQFNDLLLLHFEKQ